MFTIILFANLGDFEENYMRSMNNGKKKKFPY